MGPINVKKTNLVLDLPDYQTHISSQNNNLQLTYFMKDSSLSTEANKMK